MAEVEREEEAVEGKAKAEVIEAGAKGVEA